MRSRRGAGGVTIVELMVVVFLLALLAGIATTYWRSPGAGRIARSVHAIATSARRDAIANGIARFATGRATPEPRVPCMPNTQLSITPDQVIQWNCQLIDSAPPQPNAPGCPPAVTDDCTWGSIRANQLYLPTDMEVAYVEIESGAKDVPTAGDPAKIYWRPNGSADIHVTGAADNIGGPNESGRIWIRPKALSDTECTQNAGRCYQIVIRGLMGSAEIIDRW